MNIVTGAFNGETISLDDTHFKDCVLDDCLLMYAGGVVIFERTLISGCNYHFCNDARRTVDLLRVAGILNETFSAALRDGAFIQ